MTKFTKSSMKTNEVPFQSLLTG